MKRKFVCIVGAGELDGSELLIPDRAFVIAADGGLNHLKNAGIAPDLIMGDFDSLAGPPAGENVISYLPEKDDTDTMLAVKQALEFGAETIVIYGGLGGRLDHSMANIQALHYIANRDSIGFLVGGGTVCTVIRDCGIAFNEQMTGIISVFSISEVAAGVDLKGLKYPLSNYMMNSENPLGVSNEFTGAPASVSVKRGALAVMWSGTCYSPGICTKI